MTKLKQFIDTWFPKTREWENVSKFILESGIEITDEINSKWLVGYTNISEASKPHHKDEYIRYMEEGMFMLHDVVHQIFTLDTECSEEEYVKRQIYGELFTFYLTEYSIPNKTLMLNNKAYIEQRGCYYLMVIILQTYIGNNLIDYMWDVFIENKTDTHFKEVLKVKKLEGVFEKYSKMFQEDLVNSRKNYKFVPKIKSYCMVGASSQNHIDFYKAVQTGAIKNIKREFNIILSNEWA
jgi:hypothetical protein